MLVVRPGHTAPLSIMFLAACWSGRPPPVGDPVLERPGSGMDIDTPDPGLVEAALTARQVSSIPHCLAGP